MSIQDVITHSQAAILTAVTALKSAPDYPSDLRLAQPTVISYADNLVFKTESAGMLTTLFDLKIDVMIPRGELSEGFKFLAPILKLVADVFRTDPTIGSHVETYAGDVTAQYASGPVNGVDCIGYRFLVSQINLSE